MKRLTYNRLALSSIKARKKQYLLLITGIVLAITFSSSAVFFISSIDASLEAQHRSQYGGQDAIFTNCNELNLDSMVSDGLISEYGVAEIIAFSSPDMSYPAKGVSFAYYDESAMRISDARLLSGEFPLNEGEIAAEKSVLARFGCKDAQPGDKLTFTLSTPDGVSYLSETTEKTFTLTGILSDKSSEFTRVLSLSYGMDKSAYMDIPGIIVSSEEKIADGGKPVRVAYLLLPKGDDDYYSSGRFGMLSEYGAAEGSGCKLLLTQTGCLGGNNSEPEIMKQRAVLITVLTVVLIAASCLGIINAFGTNLDERRREIGMLRAVGASRRQIIKIFGREALILSLLSAPLGAALSYAAVKLLTKLLGNFVFVPNIFVLFLCCVTGVAVVMLSALIPLIRATRISPVQVIRNINFVRAAKNAKIISQKTFVPEKLISKRAVSFNRGRQAAITVILAICILFSGFGFTLADNIITMNTINAPCDYMVTSYHNMAAYYNWLTATQDRLFSESDKQNIIDTPYVGSVSGYKQLRANILTDEITDYMILASSDLFTPGTSETPFAYQDGESVLYSELRGHFGIEKELYPVNLMAVDDDMLLNAANSLSAGKLDLEKLNSGEQVLIYAPSGMYFDIAEYKNSGNMIYERAPLNGDETETELREYDAYAYNDAFFIGDDLSITYFEKKLGVSEDADLSITEGTTQTNANFTVGGVFTDSNVFPGDFYININDITVFTTVKGLNAMGIRADYTGFEVNLDGICDDDVDSLVMQELTSMCAGHTNFSVYSDFTYAKTQKERTVSIRTGLTAVIILFFVISTSLVNNALTADIRRSRRQIGTLRAVGADYRVLSREYMYRLLSTFKWGTLSGFICLISSAIACAVYVKVTGNALPIGEIRFTFIEPAVFTALLFALCAANLFIRLRREMNISITESIKEL